MIRPAIPWSCFNPRGSAIVDTGYPFHLTFPNTTDAQSARHVRKTRGWFIGEEGSQAIDKLLGVFFREEVSASYRISLYIGSQRSPKCVGPALLAVPAVQS